MVLSTDSVIGSKPNYKSYFMLQRCNQVIDKENIIVETHKKTSKQINKNTKNTKTKNKVTWADSNCHSTNKNKE